MKNGIGLSCLCALLVATSVVHAQVSTEQESRLGQRGQVALSAERMFGFTQTSSSGSSRTFTTLSFMGNSGYEFLATPYSIPRLAVDVFPIDGLSLGFGGTIANISRSGADDSLTIIGLYPRIGYALNITKAFSFWPRAGISYVNFDDGGDSAHILAGTIEAQFVVGVPHFGFMFGPVADIGLDATESDGKITQLGIQTGLVGWF